MLTLAIEQSTPWCSAAVARGAQIVAARSWQEDRSKNQRLFVTLPGLLAEAGASLDAIDVFAVGLGPGSFAGLRIALSAAQSLALPGQRKVAGISSAQALAFDICRTHNAAAVTIVGDARRGHLWFAEFSMTDNSLIMSRDFSLIKLDALPGILEKTPVVASPDWERIGQTLKNAAPASVSLIEDSCVPKASTVAQLVAGRPAGAESTEPLRPIYLHPPVFVPPKLEAVAGNR